MALDEIDIVKHDEMFYLSSNYLSKRLLSGAEDFVEGCCSFKKIMENCNVD